jgi:hypothetical protein
MGSKLDSEQLFLTTPFNNSNGKENVENWYFYNYSSVEIL